MKAMRPSRAAPGGLTVSAAAASGHGSAAELDVGDVRSLIPVFRDHEFGADGPGPVTPLGGPGHLAGCIPPASAALALGRGVRPTRA